MKKTVTRLADGRELIYFDADKTVDQGVRRELFDQRDLPPLEVSSELRYDPVLDEWVTVTAHRQGRTYKPPSEQCPLCPSRPGRLTEIPAADYDVVVFENRFPAFGLGAPDLPGLATDPELYPRRPGRGRCEVVCFTSDHAISFAQLSPERARLVLEAWVDRTLELSGLPGIAHVFPFENRGEEIGVTLHHPHGQIYAYPFVPQRVRQMLRSARAHAERTGRNLFADLLAAEQRSGVRVVARSAHWTAFVPTAARWPYEVHLYPNRQVPDLPALSEAERADFAEIYLDLLRRLDGLFDKPLPYIAAWYQAPVTGPDREHAYLHLQVFSVRRAANKLKYLAGAESGMGTFVNDVVPEEAARRLREVGR